MTTKYKTYPSRVFSDRADEAGAIVRLLWEIPGPKGTAIAWLSAYAINGRVAIVQTFDGHGWDIYTASGTLDLEKTVEDALARCA